ncbi:hypothetical protein ACQPZP_08005 [Spirillospora sp. CA-142024]|uniref:hypothetical protein n=1 Tax=Spirillospora sp. CA-142024 TaxID=3240036 RepID=UPI003D8F270A
MEEQAEIRRLERQRELALGGDTAAVRRAILHSWDRARRSGVDPDRQLPPVPLAEDEVVAQRREHALAQVWPTLLGTLGTAVSEPGHMLFVSDVSGTLMWSAGEASTLRQAERAHLVLGALWNEKTAGTNGVGTTLVTQRPFQVYGAEHFMSVATRFTCSGAPIRDPLTGSLLGVVDLTNSVKAPRGLSLAAVTGAARLAESCLREAADRELARQNDLYVDRLTRRLGVQSAIVTPDGHVIRADPPRWLPRRLPGPLTEGPALLPDGRSMIAERLAPGGPFFVLAQSTTSGEERPLIFGGLGLSRAWLRVDGVCHELSGRHGELMAVLLSAPGGLTAEQLAHEIYGPGGKAVTIRAELARLRRLVGYRLASAPYRLTGPVRADFIDFDRDLAAAGVAGLLDRYRGPLLPASRAPRVVALRRRLHERLRDRVLKDADADVMTCWLTSRHGRDDQELARALDTLRQPPRRASDSGR